MTLNRIKLENAIKKIISNTVEKTSCADELNGGSIPCTGHHIGKVGRCAGGQGQCADGQDGKLCLCPHEREEALALSKVLKEMTLVVSAKGGGAGRLFGSVTNQEIAAALEKQGITLDKRKIVISDPIKAVGTYTVNCKLGYEITAPLTVKIEELA